MSDLPTSLFAFLSYSRSDLEFALRLKNDLHKQGIAVWMDQEGIQPATPDWEESIRTAIRSCCVVLFIASPDARSSSYVREELAIAEMYQRPVYPVWAAGTQWMEAVPLGLGRIQYTDAREVSYETALPDIVSRLQLIFHSVPDLSLTKRNLDFIPRNPYKGLHAFTGKDTRDFFGREKLINDLSDALKASLVAEQKGRPSARILAILGPSGSGKSSVMMAALLPGLQAGRVLDSKEWVYLEPVVPGAHPLEALEISLARELPDRSLKVLRDDLKDGMGRGLHQLASLLTASPAAKVVLPIDQFEELFMHTTDEKERQLFIDLLVTAVTEPHGPVIVILTLRADFYDRPMRYPQLYQLIQSHQVPVLPMELDDLRMVIEKPAQLHDVQMTFEGNLVGDLLFEMRGQAGALPLLEFTLDQLFQRRDRHRLTLKAYEEIGGVKGALTQHLEATYNELPSEEHRKLARSLFLRLIDPGKTDKDIVSRRAALSEFSLADPAQTDLLHETIDAFIAARLITSNDNAGITSIEVSHEAVIHEWPRLLDWLNQSRDDIRQQLTIVRDVEEWERRGKPKDRLYHGSQLKDARTWAQHYTPSEIELTFLRASVTQHKRRRTLFTAISVVIILVVVSLSISPLLQLWHSFQPGVTTLADSGPGSLRQALQDASPGSRITFDSRLRGTIMLTSGDLNIVKSVKIIGPGANMLAISGGTKGSTININPAFGINVTVTILDLAFKDTTLPVLSRIGGTTTFIANSGTLIMTRCIISGNTAKGALNTTAAISNFGTLTLNDSMVSHNSFFGSGILSGGGISNVGTLRLNKSIVSYNSLSAGPGEFPISPSIRLNYDGAEADGGGIFNDGTLVLDESTVAYNSVRSQKSNIGSSATTINAPHDGWSRGGGIYNDKSLVLNNSVVSHNSVTAGQEGTGGGIMNYGTMTMRASTITDNDVSAGATGVGGGIANVGKLSIDSSTIADNRASTFGGGIFSGKGKASVFTALNTTISENKAQYGGGIGLYQSQMDLMFCTVYDNSAEDGGGIYTLDKGDHEVRNSILAGNHATRKGPDDVGYISLVGYDLAQGDLSAALIKSFEQKNPTILLVDLSADVGVASTLQNNGGPTQTHALLPGSLALDKIPLAACQIDGITTDQRGVKRPQGPACDIGAYEYTPS